MSTDCLFCGKEIKTRSGMNLHLASCPGYQPFGPISTGTVTQYAKTYWTGLASLSGWLWCLTPYNAFQVSWRLIMFLALFGVYEVFYQGKDSFLLAAIAFGAKQMWVDGSAEPLIHMVKVSAICQGLINADCQTPTPVTGLGQQLELMPLTSCGSYDGFIKAYKDSCGWATANVFSAGYLTQHP